MNKFVIADPLVSLVLPAIQCQVTAVQSLQFGVKARMALFALAMGS